MRIVSTFSLLAVRLFHIYRIMNLSSNSSVALGMTVCQIYCKRRSNDAEWIGRGLNITDVICKRIYPAGYAMCVTYVIITDEMHMK